MSGLRRLFKFRRNSEDCSDSDQVLPVKNSETENGLMSPALKIQKSDGDVLVLSDKEERQREKMVDRLVSKRGKKRIRTSAGIRGNGRRLQDIFTTVIQCKWWTLLFLITLVYASSWIVFAVAWHVLVILQGDKSAGDCVTGINNFISSILLSMELQQTIGYGSRVPTDKCLSAAILQGLQTVLGMLIDAALVGIFFAKIARPGRRAVTVMWSKNAVVTLRDGVMCLVWQMTDIQVSQLVETHFRAQLRMNKVTKEGELINNYMQELKVTTQLPTHFPGEDRAVVILPVQIMHPIDENSPLYSLDQAGLNSSQMEIVVVMEGVVEPSGNTTQAMSSYTQDEIIWGARFAPCVEYNSDKKYFNVYCKKLNSIIMDNVTARISAEMQVKSSQLSNVK